MIEILKKLVTFKTLSTNTEVNNKAIHWLKKEADKYQLYSKILVYKGSPSLIITTQKTKKPKLFLAAHLDVVPGADNLFKARISNNKIYGRGVFDMKYAVASYWQLIKDLSSDLDKYNFGIMITTDEEIGGFNGTAKILDTGYCADLCFLPDSSSNWVFENQAKGVWHVLVEAVGKSAHGSCPWHGQNAVENLINFLSSLQDHFDYKKYKKQGYNCQTLNIGKFEGGRATNVVADYAKAYLDFRFTPKQSLKDIQNLINQVAKKFKNIKYSSIVSAESYYFPQQSQYFKLYQSIAYKMYKKKIKFRMSHGSSDARFFGYKNIQTIVISPNGGGHHSDKEWLDLADWQKFYQVLKEFVLKVCKN